MRGMGHADPMETALVTHQEGNEGEKNGVKRGNGGFYGGKLLKRKVANGGGQREKRRANLVRRALAAGSGEDCCENRDSPSIPLLRSAYAAVIARTSHGSRNRSFPLAWIKSAWSCRLRSSPDGRRCTASPSRNERSCPWSYWRDRRNSWHPWGGCRGARWDVRRPMPTLPPAKAAGQRPTGQRAGRWGRP